MNLLSINAVCVICAVLLVMTVIPPTSATTGGESDSLLLHITLRKAALCQSVKGFIELMLFAAVFVTIFT